MTTDAALTPADVAAIAALLERVSPGEWKNLPNPDKPNWWHHVCIDTDNIKDLAIADVYVGTQGVANAELMAKAPSMLRALLADRERLAASKYLLLTQRHGRGERTPYALLETLEQAQNYIFEQPHSATEWTMHIGNDMRQWRRITEHAYSHEDERYSVHWTILEMPIIRAVQAAHTESEAHDD